MIGTLLENESAGKTRLTPVLCAECGHPVSHMDPRVPGALAGGMCTRCRKDRQGKEKRVYTYERRVDPS